jgi:hypothetical protein
MINFYCLVEFVAVPLEQTFQLDNSAIKDVTHVVDLNADDSENIGKKSCNVAPVIS